MKEHDPGSDSSLIARFLSGDKTAFEALINPYRQRLYSYLCRMVGDSEAAKDLFQDVIISVLKALPKSGLNPETAGEIFLADIGIPKKSFAKIGINSTLLFDKDFWIHVRRQR